MATQHAFIGLGSNQNTPAAQVHSALNKLDALPGTTVVAHSPLYLTPPVGPVEQPPFVNGVAKISTELAPQALLDHLTAIEYAAGRRRQHEVRWGPRNLDLDLLLYGTLTLATETLTLPHPRMHQRAFVLAPLNHIAPDLRLANGKTTAQALAECPDRDTLILLATTSTGADAAATGKTRATPWQQSLAG